MDYIKIIETDYNGEPKSVALCAPKLTFSGGPANTIQLSIEQDGQDAYVDLWLNEAILLRDKLNEWLEEKGEVILTKEDLQQCEGCSGKWEYDKMKSDSEGVPLCENCYDCLQKEEANWICKKCQRKSDQFTKGEEWEEDNLCNTCADANTN